MKASFIPGELYLTEADGFHVVTMGGVQIVRSRSERAAFTKFTELRRELETKYPTVEPTPEEKAELLRKAMADEMIGPYSAGSRKKKTTAGGTRTFGG